MVLLFLGKLLIAVGILFQAYTLYEDKATAATFNTKLATCLKTCDMIPAEIRAHIQEHLRLVIVGMLACSGLMVFLKTWLLKLPVLIGLVTLLWMKYWPLTAVPSYKDQEFWGAVAVIGGIIYLMGADCSSCNKTKTKTTTYVAESTSNESRKQSGN